MQLDINTASLAITAISAIIGIISFMLGNPHDGNKPFRQLVGTCALLFTLVFGFIALFSSINWPNLELPSATTGSSTTNLIRGGDFEGDFLSGAWVRQGGNETQVTGGHRSEYAIESIQTSTAQAAASWKGIGQRVSVTPGATYAFTAWLRWANAVGVHMGVEWVDANGVVLERPQVFYGGRGDSDWTRQGNSVTAPSQATFGTFFIWHGVVDGTTQNQEGSSLWIDDVQVTEVK